MNRFHLTALTLVMACSVASAARQPEQKLVDDLRACLLQKDDARRLACYDEMARPYQESSARRALQPAAEESVPAAPPVAAAPPKAATSAAAPKPAATAAAAKQAEERFGFRGEVARAELDRKQDKPQIERLTAKITKVSSLPRGEQVVTLDNGQVWRQKRPDPHSRLEVGDEVTIRAGSLGSFWMNGPSGRAVSVNRIQ